MFGISNQLLGVLGLCVGTTILIKMKKTSYLWVTVVPMAFMAVTTMTASYQLFWTFIDKAAANPEAALVHYLDASLIVICAVLTAIIVADSFHKWYGYLVGKRPMLTSEIPFKEASGFPIDTGSI
jgi:carbon starvation protein